MSQCSFQAQLVSIMDIVAKAAVAEIKRRVDDGCAVIKVELSRSRKDIDTLKRKCVMMENELRRVKGRGRRRVWTCGTSDRYPTPLKTVCVTDAGADVIRDQDDATQQTTHNIKQSACVLDDGIRPPVIKDERSEQETESRAEDAGNVEYDYERNVQHIHAQEDVDKQQALFGDPEIQNACFMHARTSTEHPEQMTLREVCESDLRLQVKAEEDNEEERLQTEDIRCPRDQLSFAHEERDAKLLPEPSRDIQASQNTGIYPQPDVSEASRNNRHPVERTHTELYDFGQVNRSDPNRQTWCNENTQERSHMTHGDRLSSVGAIYRQQHHTTLPAPADHLHDANVTSQVESDACMQTFPEYGLGTLGAVRRFRTHWRSSVDAEKRFSCSFCEKCFSRFSQLKEHLRSHTGEKPFTCTQCGRSFTKHCNLIRHAVVHSGEKPYQCGQCGKCFTQRSSLKSHQRTHLGEWDGLPVHR
ncbi:zinc finger and SCAN domain-containing protein 2 isoform X1 [Xyrauchen texanus]|uniref:zinc finger and SCAN domain-containing protein 2 isoform X1 n=1 Tax=Xyrauchen texanus TaxID=154827 RepID=UPI0022420340|nr:zinc finger and SCAN domain-containing protein 2 isoform X1 [Xyrauchen texanus]